MQEPDRHLQGYAKLEQAKAFARAPVSGYRVGAVLLEASGQAYPGANLEFPGQPLSHTVHAEQAAVAQALMAGEKEWTDLYVSAAPCGHCRQFLREFNDGSLRIHLPATAESGPVTHTLAELLPHAFGGEDFLKTPAVEAASSFSHKPHISSTGLSNSRETLRDYARRLRSFTYAPYSSNRAVVVLTGAGQQIGGVSLESAAFNPTLGPMACALSQWRLAGLPDEQIESAGLIQSDISHVNWEEQSRSLLASVSTAALSSEIC